MEWKNRMHGMSLVKSKELMQYSEHYTSNM